MTHQDFVAAFENLKEPAAKALAQVIPGMTMGMETVDGPDGMGTTEAVIVRTATGHGSAIVHRPESKDGEFVTCPLLSSGEEKIRVSYGEGVCWKTLKPAVADSTQTALAAQYASGENFFGSTVRAKKGEGRAFKQLVEATLEESLGMDFYVSPDFTEGSEDVAAFVGRWRVAGTGLPGREEWKAVRGDGLYDPESTSTSILEANPGTMLANIAAYEVAAQADKAMTKEISAYEREQERIRSIPPRDKYALFGDAFIQEHKLNATAAQLVRTLAHSARMAPDNEISWYQLNHERPFTSFHGGSPGGARAIPFTGDDPLMAVVGDPIQNIMSRETAIALFTGYYGLLGKEVPEIDPPMTLRDTIRGKAPKPIKLPEPPAAGSELDRSSRSVRD